MVILWLLCGYSAIQTARTGSTVPKLAIYVPKKEMKVIEKWRKQINFSKVFMKALGQEIRERSRIAATDGNRLKAAAQYYRKKMADSSEALVEFGIQIGNRHVIDCRLSPESIHALLKLKEVDAWQPDDTAMLEECISDEMVSINQMLSESGYDEEESSGSWRNVVYRGYIEGVATAWRQVCEHM